jgi:hypothetical protein
MRIILCEGEPCFMNPSLQDRFRGCLIGPARGEARQTARGLGLCGIAVVIASGLFLVVTATIGIRYPIEMSNKNKCRAQLERIGEALQNYREIEGCFPPASIVDATGRPMHSWRVLLVPYLESNWFFDRYNLDEPWDGPNNKQLTRAFYEPSRGSARDITEVRRCYQCPSALDSPSSFCTDYAILVDLTEPPADITARSLRADAAKGWKARTHAGAELVIVEIHNSGIHWMAPRDLSVHEMGVLINDSNEPSTAKPCVGHSLLVLANGTSQFLDEEATRERIRVILRQPQAGPVRSKQSELSGPSVSGHVR